MDINVVDIVDFVKKEIQEAGSSVKERYLATKYYSTRIKEYSEQEQLVLFGAGERGIFLYQMLIKEEIEKKVVCFCDNAKSQHGKRCKGKVILSLEECLTKYPNAMYIITPDYYENEIMRQLLNMGVSSDKISIFIKSHTGLEER